MLVTPRGLQRVSKRSQFCSKSNNDGEKYFEAKKLAISNELSLMEYCEIKIVINS